MNQGCWRLYTGMLYADVHRDAGDYALGCCPHTCTGMQYTCMQGCCTQGCCTQRCWRLHTGMLYADMHRDAVPRCAQGCSTRTRGCCTQGCWRLQFCVRFTPQSQKKEAAQRPAPLKTTSSDLSRVLTASPQASEMSPLASGFPYILLNPPKTGATTPLPTLEEETEKLQPTPVAGGSSLSTP